MDLLSEVQRDMRFMGWKGDPETGFSHKEDADGKTVARHHDATWVADVEEATARAARLAAIREIERRAVNAALCSKCTKAVTGVIACDGIYPRSRGEP